MSRITLFPGDGNANIDNHLAKNIDYTGLDPEIHAVQWFDTYGWIEYREDTISGAKPENVQITSIEPYLDYIAQAEEIIYAANNPLVGYVTVYPRLYFGDWSYVFSAPVEIYTPNTPLPEGTTTQVPPTPEDFQQLYWYEEGDQWVISPVDPTLSLADAQQELILKIQTSGAMQVDDQARIYSSLQLTTSPDPGALPTADYYGLDLADYQTYIDGEITTMSASVMAATAVPQLYMFNWMVEGDPNA
jgi:hypothetical protein